MRSDSEKLEPFDATSYTTVYDLPRQSCPARRRKVYDEETLLVYLQRPNLQRNSLVVTDLNSLK